jgi:CNT family concentrative nucleoside transporter
MVAYAAILKDTLSNAGAHVLVASIISAPAGVLLARIMIPHKKGEAGPVGDYTSALRYDSTMDAITKGVQDGLMVVVNVAAMLIVFVAFVGITNNILHAFPDVDGAPLTLQRITGWAFAPLAWLVGVPWSEAQTAGSLLGSKLFLTEFKAFIDLGLIPADQLSARSRMLMTYALCGFANVASVGIMTGGMTVLMPDRRNEIWPPLRRGRQLHHRRHYAAGRHRLREDDEMAPRRKPAEPRALAGRDGRAPGGPDTALSVFHGGFEL